MPKIISYLFTSAYSGITSLYGAISTTYEYNYNQPPSFPWIAILYFFVVLIGIVSMWIIFKKAGKPGWAAIVPIYNIMVMLQIAGKPTWWVILYFIPFINIIISVIVIYNIALAFGKGVGFTVGMMFLPFIFYPILAFGNAAYRGQTTPPTEAPPTEAPPTTPQTPISQ